MNTKNIRFFISAIFVLIFILFLVSRSPKKHVLPVTGRGSPFANSTPAPGAGVALEGGNENRNVQDRSDFHAESSEPQPADKIENRGSGVSSPNFTSPPSSEPQPAATQLAVNPAGELPVVPTAPSEPRPAATQLAINPAGVMPIAHVAPADPAAETAGGITKPKAVDVKEVNGKKGDPPPVR